MKVKRISGKNFMSYDDLSVEFPERGIVLITGKNGEGKSAIIEAVDVAKYNKTLRGTPWWRPGQAGYVTLVGDDLEITRKRSPKGVASLSWRGGDNYDTNSKAQSELEKFIEPRDIWRRSSVFSSRISLSFTSATDGERKKLLENILGLDKFESAKKACTKDLSAIKVEFERCKAALSNVSTKLHYERKRLDEATRRLETIEVPDAPQNEDLASLREELELKRRSAAKLSSKLRKFDNAGREHDVHAKHLERQLNNLKEENCPTCGQSIPDELISSLKEDIKAARKAANKEREALAKEETACTEELDAMHKDLELLQRKIGVIEGRENYYKGALEEHKILKSTARDAESALRALEADYEDLRATIEHLDEELSVLKACEKVLGIKGVRSVILSELLTALEAATNNWLQIMDAKQRIQIKPYSEKKTGGTTDSIAILVSGAGGGFGYSAASSGQQRRIDVALVMGLAELAQSSYGMAGSTTFFDEVFDTLDEEGTKGVVAALERMAEDRTVVVISHSSHVQSALKPDVHLNVENGRIVRV